MRQSLVIACTASALVAGTAIAACGTATGNQTGSAANSAADNAKSTAVVTAAYVKTTDAKTAKVNLTGQFSTEINGKSQSVPINANGSIDFANKATDLVENVAGGKIGNTETRYLNGMLYQRLPSGASGLAGGKQWIAVNVSQLAAQHGDNGLSQLMASAPSDPTSVLTYLRAIDGNVTSDGPATVDGTPTTHYTATINLDKVASADPNAAAATKQLESQLGTNTLPVQLWIDQQGRVRQLGLNETIAHPVAGSTAANGPTSVPNVGPVHTTITVSLSDYGTPVHIVAPPADQTDQLTGK